MEGGGAIASFLRVGRGVIDVKSNRAQVVLSNLSRAPLKLRAGKLVGAGFAFAEEDFEMRACLEEELDEATSPTSLRDAVLRRADGTPNGDPVLTEEPPFPELADVWPRLSERVRAAIRKRGLVRSAEELPPHLAPVQFGKDAILTPAQQRLAWTILAEYADVFNASHTVPSRTTKFRATIDTGTSTPVSSAPYRTSPAQKAVIDKAIDEMLAAKVIRPSRSPWASPVVLVPKKGGEIRFCADYRRLNKLTKIETYPLPRVDETLRAYEGSLYFSVMDMQSGYWQVPLSEEAIPKTAFISHRGLHEYVVLPFGPVNAPGYFQRMMDEVLGGLKWTSVLVYIDDLIVFSRTFEAHLGDLAAVFERLRESGLTLKPKKCQMFTDSVLYLGHVVSRDGVAMDPSKISAVRHMPRPQTRAELVSFLGLAGYYRRYIKHFADVSYPLRQLLLPESGMADWGVIHDEAMHTLRTRLCTAPALAHPDFTKPFTLMTDASGVGLGAVLTQKSSEGHEHVIEYASRSLQLAERKWSGPEQEALAVKWACEVMRPYLHGTRFTLYTDHAALQWLFKNQSSNGRLQRWALALMEYQYDVIHRSGKSNANADGPSRLPLPEGQGRGEDVGDEPPARMLALKRTREEPGALVGQDDQPNAWTEGAVERRRVIDPRLREEAREPSDLPSREEFILALKADSRLGALYHYMDTQEAPADQLGAFQAMEPYYLIEDGLLMMYDGLKKSLTKGPHVIQRRLVVPTTLRRRVIMHHHSTPESGHLAAQATYARLRDIYWWPGIWRDTSRLVKSCHGCQVHKDAPDGKSGLLQPIPASAPWEVVGIDLVGPLTLTPRYNRYILTMVDFFSRWTIFVPLRESKAKDVVDAVMEHLVHKFGPPQAFVSDKGMQFVGGLFQRMLARLNVRYSSTSGYHPQANGRTERIHRVLNSMLTAQVNKHHANWDEFVSASAWAVNTLWSRKTGLTPYEILFGTPARVPSEVLYGSRQEVAVDVNEYNLRLLGTLRNVYQRVRKAHDIYVKSMAEYYNRARHETSFEEGELVKLYQPARQAHMPKRLQIRWSGPHRIVGPGPNAPNNYVVDVDGTTVVCHVGRIRPYHEAPPPNDADLPMGVPPKEDAIMGDVLNWTELFGAGDTRLSPNVALAANEPQGMDWGGEAEQEFETKSVGGEVQPPQPVPGPGMQMASPARKQVAWDNLLPSRGLVPVTPSDGILARHLIFFWTEDEEGGDRRWWLGLVWDRPGRDRPTFEVQPFNTRDKRKPLAAAQFTLVWWDPRVRKEEWRMVKKAHLQPLIMEVEVSHVIMTGLEWGPGHTLPQGVLEFLTGEVPFASEPDQALLVESERRLPVGTVPLGIPAVPAVPEAAPRAAHAEAGQPRRSARLRAV